MLVNATRAFLSAKCHADSFATGTWGVGTMAAVTVVMRFISLVLVVAALMLLGADGITSLEHHGQIDVRSLETVWGLFDKSAIEAFKAWDAAHLPGFLSGVVFNLLALPGWAVTGVIGVILAFLFGRRLDHDHLAQE